MLFYYLIILLSFHRYLFGNMLMLSVRDVSENESSVSSDDDVINFERIRSISFQTDHI